MAARKNQLDLTLLMATLGLLVLGIIMVFSSSYSTAALETGDTYHYIKRQLLWAAIGLGGMAITANVDYRKWRKWGTAGYLISLGLLALVLLVGNDALGARRAFDLGPLRFQPSELAKLACINFVAAYVAGKRSEIHQLMPGFLVPLGLVGFAFGLIMLEPDMGTGLTLMGTFVMMMFAAGISVSCLVSLALMAIPALIALVVAAPYRWARITAFWNPFRDPQDTGWNIIQSLYAVGSGGLFGLGLGASRQKFSYLPEQHTDFIFSIIAEELGFLGSALVVALFLIVAWRGYRAALKAPDLFGSLLATGLTTLVVLQACINIGVATSSMPATGITLPLISFGGSSLSVTLAGLGVLLNISSASLKRGSAANGAATGRTLGK